MLRPVFLLAIPLLAAACARAPKDSPMPSPPPWAARDSARIAAAQLEIHTGREVDLIVEHIDRAGADGADLVVLGEYHLGPFSTGDFDSPGTRRVAEAARRNAINVAVGGWEEFTPGAYSRLEADGYANTVLLFDRAGKVVGSYRKAHAAVGQPPHFWPPASSDHEYRMVQGSGFPVFDLDFARVGIMTCFDGFFPESAACLSLNGAEIILWLNGRPGPVGDFLVKADVFRTYTAMVATNLAPGSGTTIVTWPAAVLAEVTETGNHYIVADVDLKALRENRANSRIFHQRRPELYGTLTSDAQPWRAYEALGITPPPAPPRDAPLP